MIMNLDYKLIGKNSPAIVFLHGWGMSKECFDDIIQKIDEGPMILSLDFFGFGKSLEPKEYFDTYEYAYSVSLGVYVAIHITITADSAGVGSVALLRAGGDGDGRCVNMLVSSVQFECEL